VREIKLNPLQQCNYVPMINFRCAAENVSHVLSSFRTMGGMLCLAKAGIASIRLISFCPRVGGLFQHLLPVLEAQKALYYATMTFSALHLCFKVDPATEKVSLQMPQMRDGTGIDWAKSFYLMGGIFDTGNFIQKGGLVNFGLYPAVGRRLGGLQLFKFRGEAWTLEKVPVLNTISLAPKELFFILASTVEIFRWMKPFLPCTESDEATRQKKFEIIELLSLAASVGRIIGLSGYRYFGTIWQFALIDFVGQNASLFRFIIVSHRARRNYLTSAQSW
jgi:hypothetical protein